MKDDDPEKRIRELERGLAEARSSPHAPYYDAGFTNAGYTAPARRGGGVRWPIILLFVAPTLLAPIVMAIFWGVNQLRNTPANVNSGAATSAPPITLEHGATFSLGGSGANDTIACNDGSLTLNSNNSIVNISGHCASLKLLGFDNQLNIESVDVIEVSGFGNVIKVTACNNGKLTLSSYGNSFTAGGHCASLTVTANDNQVKVDGVDTIVISNFNNRITVTGHGGNLTISTINAYGNQVQFDTVDSIDVSSFNNTVTYHSGSPKITDSGRGNTVKKKG